MFGRTLKWSFPLKKKKKKKYLATVLNDDLLFASQADCIKYRDIFILRVFD